MIKTSNDHSAAARALLAWLDGTRTKKSAFASRIGVTEAALYNWLKGARTPTMGPAMAIQAATDGAIKAEWWLSDKEASRVAAASTEAG
jgi:DNA-binding transcriptional regulator YdaS (Cro superfamily)